MVSLLVAVLVVDLLLSLSEMLPIVIVEVVVDLLLIWLEMVFRWYYYWCTGVAVATAAAVEDCVTVHSRGDGELLEMVSLFVVL